MKKQLLASTMLAAAGVMATAGAASAQNTVKLSIGGYMEQIVGFVFERPPAALTGGAVSGGPDQQTEAEIHFNGSGKLDNGIQIRVRVDMEVAGSPGNDVDEQYMIIRGNFGQVTLGAEDNAGHLMTIGYSGSWATGVGQNLTFDTTDWIPLASGFTGAGNRFDGTLNDVRLRSGDNDSSKISYYTPRFAGVQIGASYIPNFEQQTFGAAGAGGADALPDKGSYNEGYALGINFTRKFGGVGVGVAAGYLTANPPTGTGATTTENMQSYSLAARLDFGPIRVAAAWKHNEDLFSGTTSLNGDLYDVGVRWRGGPNAVSFGYRKGEMEGAIATPGDEEETAWMLSYARTLGPGVKWTANLLWSETDDEAPGLNSSYDGYALTTSVRLSF